MLQTQNTLRPLTSEGREKLFGKFRYKPDPLPGAPERIKLTDRWAQENLVTVSLVKLPAHEGANIATFHQRVKPRFDELIDAWERLGLLGDILSWNGGYNARFVRGSTTTLSAHCLPARTQVWTPNGPAAIADLAGYKGEVFAYSEGNSLPVRVGEHFKNGVKPLVEVVAMRHRLLCTPTHPVLVARKRTLAKHEWIPHQHGRGAIKALYWTEMVEAQHLRRGDRLVVSAQRHSGDHTAGVTPDHAEVIGMFLGDGCVHHRHGKPVYVSFCIPRCKRVREHARTLLTRFMGREPKETDGALVYYTNAALELFAPYDHKARDKEIPAAVFAWPMELQRRFILGLVYTDGTLNTTATRAGNQCVTYRFKLGSQRMVEQLKQLLTAVGLVPSAITIDPGGPRVIKDVHTVSNTSYVIAARDPYQLLSPDADPMYSQRVVAGTDARWHKTSPCYGYEAVSPDHTHEYVREVRGAGSAEVYDIEVPGPHNFVADGVVVSNSWGSAFDINAKWNPLGSPPAAMGVPGNVMRLVPIAEKCGWFWGGNYPSRVDAMHFELSRI